MCSLKNGFLGSFCSAAYPPCTAFFSRKHFGHSLKKHVVGFKVVCKNQVAFFSGTSSLNPINIQELNRHFLANVPGGIPAYLCRSQPYLSNNLCRPHPCLSKNLCRSHPRLSKTLCRSHPCSSKNLCRSHPCLSQNLCKPHPCLSKNHCRSQPYLSKNLREEKTVCIIVHQVLMTLANQSAFFNDGEFWRLILSTKTKGHSLSNISGL